MNILVIGGTGRVAGCLINDLLAGGNTVTVGVRDASRISACENLTVAHLDLRNSVDTFCLCLPILMWSIL